MDLRPILAPDKPINNMSIDELKAFLKASDEDFASSFRSLNSPDDKAEYLNKAIDYRESLILENEDKFKTANFFRQYEQLNFEFFSSRKAELTEEFADNVRTDIRNLYDEVIEELLQPRLSRKKFDFKRMNEFKYYLNQIILNKHNYSINRASIEIIEHDFIKNHPDEISDLSVDLEKHYDVKEDLPDSYFYKTENYNIYKDGRKIGESHNEVFEKFIKYSRIKPNKENAPTYGRLKPKAKENNLLQNEVISHNVKYILNELNTEYSIGKQTYYNFFTFNDNLIIDDFIKYKNAKIDAFELYLIELKDELTKAKPKEIMSIKRVIDSVKSEIEAIKYEILLLNKELDIKEKKTNRDKLIELNKKVEFDKKFFINLAMYLQLDPVSLEKFLNINGYSLESRNEQDTIIRLLYKNQYDVKTIDMVLTSYGYKSLRISKKRLELMTKTSFDLANEFVALDEASRKLLSSNERISHYRNIESALNLLEAFFTNRNYNKLLFIKMYSSLYKSDYDFVEKQREISKKSGHKPSFTGMQEKINQELDKFDDYAEIRVDEIFKTKENSFSKTYEGWRKYHVELLDELKTFKMYYAEFDSPYSKEKSFIKKSTVNLIKRLETRHAFINDKLNKYSKEKIKLEYLSKLKKNQKNRLNKLNLYIELLSEYEEETMFYLRDSRRNDEILFSKGVTEYIDTLQKVVDVKLV